MMLGKRAVVSLHKTILDGFNAEFMRRAIHVFQRDNQMRNAFMQDKEARDMLMGLMFRRVMRAARAA